MRFSTRGKKDDRRGTPRSLHPWPRRSLRGGSASPPSLSLSVYHLSAFDPATSRLGLSSTKLPFRSVSLHNAEEDQSEAEAVAMPTPKGRYLRQEPLEPYREDRGERVSGERKTLVPQSLKVLTRRDGSVIVGPITIPPPPNSRPVSRRLFTANMAPMTFNRGSPKRLVGWGSWGYSRQWQVVSTGPKDLSRSLWMSGPRKARTSTFGEM